MDGWIFCQWDKNANLAAFHGNQSSVKSCSANVFPSVNLHTFHVHQASQQFLFPFSGLPSLFSQCHAPQMCVKPAEIETRCRIKRVQAAPAQKRERRRGEGEPSPPSPAVDTRLSFVPPNFPTVSHTRQQENAAADIWVIYTKSGSGGEKIKTRRTWRRLSSDSSSWRRLQGLNPPVSSAICQGGEGETDASSTSASIIFTTSTSSYSISSTFSPTSTSASSPSTTPPVLTAQVWLAD